MGIAGAPPLLMVDPHSREEWLCRSCLVASKSRRELVNFEDPQLFEAGRDDKPGKNVFHGSIGNSAIYGEPSGGDPPIYHLAGPVNGTGQYDIPPSASWIGGSQQHSEHRAELAAHPGEKYSPQRSTRPLHPLHLHRWHRF